MRRANARGCARRLHNPSGAILANNEFHTQLTAACGARGCSTRCVRSSERSCATSRSTCASPERVERSVAGRRRHHRGARARRPRAGRPARAREPDGRAAGDLASGLEASARWRPACQVLAHALGGPRAVAALERAMMASCRATERSTRSGVAHVDLLVAQERSLDRTQRVEQHLVCAGGGELGVELVVGEDRSGRVVQPPRASRALARRIASSVLSSNGGDWRTAMLSTAARRRVERARGGRYASGPGQKQSPAALGRHQRSTIARVAAASLIKSHAEPCGDGLGVGRSSPTPRMPAMALASISSASPPVMPASSAAQSSTAGSARAGRGSGGRPRPPTARAPAPGRRPCPVRWQPSSAAR